MYNPNAKRRRIKPYARPTSFDYNVRYDIRQYHDVKYNRVKKPFFMSASNDEVFRVMEGELLVKSTSPNARYNDKELHVFSFANGLSAPANTAGGMPDRTFNGPTQNSIGQQRDLRRSILSTVQYMGVAVTEFSPGRDVYEQGFVATIAGLNTLYNNGADTIFPGQTVCLDLPIVRGGSSSSSSTQYKRATQMGIPRDKLQFIMRPHSEMLKDYGEGSLSLVNRFIVGTAISYSRPGDTVDVILHRMNYTSSSVGGVAPQGGYGSHSGPSQYLSGMMLKALGGDDDDAANQNLRQVEDAVDLLGSDAKKAYSEMRGATGLAKFEVLLEAEDFLARAEALVAFDKGGRTVTVPTGSTVESLLKEVQDAVNIARSAGAVVVLTADVKTALLADNTALFEADSANGIANSGTSKKVLSIHQIAAFMVEFSDIIRAAAAITVAGQVLGRAGGGAPGDKPKLVNAQGIDLSTSLTVAAFDKAIGQRGALGFKPTGAASTIAPSGISAAVGGPKTKKIGRK